MRIPKFQRLNRPMMMIALVISIVLLASAQTLESKSPGAQTVSFHDIAADGGAGLHFVHTAAAPRMDKNRAFYEKTLVTPATFVEAAAMASIPNGLPGVAILDFDDDGDEDVYLCNSVGGANALFSNQLVETGELQFIDVAAAAGVDATDHDSSGACFADIDNDGDEDLFVVGLDGPHLLFENQSDGTFVNIAPASGDTFADTAGAISCTMGDVDNDGLVEVFVSYAWDFATTVGCQIEPFVHSLPNKLFHNLGGGRFEDISAASGILNLEGGDIVPGIQGNTWAVTMYDYDFDGDVDIFNFDDNCAFPLGEFGGVDHGLIQIFNNDGHGSFSNATIEAGTDIPGTWMGVSVADFNRDGYLDVFAPSIGDYSGPTLGHPVSPLGANASRWLLGGPDGAFTDPGVGDLISTTFGWGTAAEDFDNDGDTDIAYAGGLNANAFWINDTPGNVMLNDGDANFTYALDALSTNNLGRNPVGLSAGDLDNDGFVDLVVTSNAVIPEDVVLIPAFAQHGAVLDETAFFFLLVDFLPDGTARWNGTETEDGGVAVEMNQGESGLGWAKVRTVGTVGLLDGGQVNRDGIGAILSFTPNGGKTAMRPVLGGSSYISQDSLIAHFGLGTAAHGTLEVLWPGGTRNRLYEVLHGSTVTVPEIPCSFDADWPSFQVYESCVQQALDDLTAAGVLNLSQKGRFLSSAIRAFHDAH